MSVDIILFPLDTLKTRLQSSQGFFKSGGFRGIYSGIASAAAGSAPAGEYKEGKNSLWKIGFQEHRRPKFFIYVNYVLTSKIKLI